MDFTKGDILVIDRAGPLMFKDMDQALAANIIRKFIPEAEITKKIEDVVDEFTATLKGCVDSKQIWLAVGLDAFRAALIHAKALVCSRGRHPGEISAKEGKIPCISSCHGATENIATGQRIVIDAKRGEVYDASLLSGQTYLVRQGMLKR